MEVEHLLQQINSVATAPDQRRKLSNIAVFDVLLETLTVVRNQNGHQDPDAMEITRQQVTLKELKRLMVCYRANTALLKMIPIGSRSQKRKKRTRITKHLQMGNFTKRNLSIKQKVWIPFNQQR